VIFQADYDKIELQKYSYDVNDVITIMSPKNVTKIMSQTSVLAGLSRFSLKKKEKGLQWFGPVSLVRKVYSPKTGYHRFGSDF